MSTPAPSTTPWIVRLRPVPEPAMRLFCVPYAGGGPHVFQPWPPALDPSVEVCAVSLPGRGRRFGELAHDRLLPLVHDLAAALVPWLDRPFAVFGHSMGAYIAFELARTLRDNGLAEPRHLFVSGASAPHLSLPEPLHHLPDSEFTAALHQLNGIDREVLAEGELLALMLPVIRRDFEVVETYQAADGAPLDCPVSVFGGSDDWLAPVASLHSWRVHTTAVCSVDVLPGDHFFLNTARVPLLRAISERLAGRPGATG